MMNNGTTTEVAPVQAGNAETRAFERIERIIEQRCDQLLKIAGKGNFDHPAMFGLRELFSLQDKVNSLKNIALEKLNPSFRWPSN